MRDSKYIDEQIKRSLEKIKNLEHHVQMLLLEQEEVEKIAAGVSEETVQSEETDVV